MNHLDYMETHIINVCNLRCKGCSHFSPFVGAEDAAVDIVSFERDVRRISELFDHIFTFRLLGGEPFLCRRIVDFASIARRWLPATDIRLVSNGTLIPNISTEILLALAEQRIGVDISNYPVTQKLEAEIVSRLESTGVDYRLSEPVSLFHRRLNLEGNEEIPAVFSACPTKHCVFFLNGKLANCSAPLLAKYINKRFGTRIDAGHDLLDLHREGLTAEDVLSYLSEPMSACRYCAAPEEFTWETTDDPKLEDWLVRRSYEPAGESN